ncbi:MAG: hypothetical protein HQL91_01635 [Magnetococcales bacterium]|nr:hypothetical protein [Magnetococcales bacterium]
MHTKTSAGSKRSFVETTPKLPKRGPMSLLAALPHMAGLALATRRWKRDVLNGVLHRMQQSIYAHPVLGARRCPDGQRPHPSVCHRGWRGELCQGCRSGRG